MSELQSVNLLSLNEYMMMMMRAISFKHSLLVVDVDVCMWAYV